MDYPVSYLGIRAALDALLLAADELGIPRAAAYRVAVIVDEYCSNLIRHDPTITPQSRFEMQLQAIDGGAMLSIREDGQSFDPTIRRAAQVREIGGQGIKLMQGLASRLDYQSGPDGNVFCAWIPTDGKYAGQD